MIITCQDCQSQYEVADEKVHGRSVRIRCRACGSRIFLSLEATTPSYGAEAERLPCPPREGRNAIAPPRDDSADATAPRHAAYAAPADDQPHTGGRNETSVLFTLAALSGSRKSAKAAPAPTRQDSGLIDLNAMSTSGG
ncbi:MAG: zinc-ribbon domain-containing protein, partial [Polyangiaceae bacterium]